MAIDLFPEVQAGWKDALLCTSDNTFVPYGLDFTAVCKAAQGVDRVEIRAFVALPQRCGRSGVQSCTLALFYTATPPHAFMQ